MNTSEFDDLGLHQWLVEQCTEMGIVKPTPIQRDCIPKVLKREKYMGISHTGSGKTLAFALPILQVLSEDPHGIFALILTPTRELAGQIADQFRVLGKSVNLKVLVAIGGMNMVSQAHKLNTFLPEIIVATPGRLADLLQSGNDHLFKRIKIVVYDEADRLFAGQYEEQINVILDALPSKRQTLIFSATMSKDLEEISQMHNIEPFIWKTENEVATVESLDQRYVLLPKVLVKNASLVHIINNFQGKYPDNSIIVFTKSCKLCQIVSVALKNLGFANVALNSNLRQWEREASISKFKSNKVKLLISTDLASRGLDIPMVDLVINYNVPPFPTNYIHRVGRTARAGRGGQAITLITEREIPALKNIQKEIKTELTELRISDKKILENLLQVEVAFREAAINLDGQEVDKRKENYKRKQQIIDGEKDISQNKKSKKPKPKTSKTKKNKKSSKSKNSANDS